MKQRSVFLLIAYFLIIPQIVSSQTTDAELKVIFVKSLIKTDIYLSEASNTAYDNMCRIEYHKKAIRSYKEFDRAYIKLKSNLAVELNDKLSGIINVYSQIAKDETFRHLSDASTITALSICSIKLDEVLKILMK